MHANVHINLVKDGKVIDSREGHNVWVDIGREYLTKLITFDSPINSTTEGTVDMVADFPLDALAGTTFLDVSRSHVDGTIETRITLVDPTDAATLLIQLNDQVDGMAFTLGGSNGLVLTPDAQVPVEIRGGSAIETLGLLPQYVTPAGMGTTPLETRHVTFIGFGIGGTQQSSAMAFLPPIIDAYPPGADPNATTGTEYNKDFPMSPPITSLERPVRVSGGTVPYPGDPGDVWLVSDPKFVSYVVVPGIISFHAVLTSPDVVYPPFLEMPLSEVGLFLEDSSLNSDFNAGKLVAYYSFGTLLLTTGVNMELVWTVSF